MSGTESIGRRKFSGRSFEVQNWGKKGSDGKEEKKEWKEERRV